MPSMTDDELNTKLNALGLDVDNTPASQPDIASIPDPDQSDAPAGGQNPNIGYHGDPDQEKSALVAATPEDQQAAMNSLSSPSSAPSGPNASVQPSAQVASADPSDMGDAMSPEAKAMVPVPGKSQTPTDQQQAKSAIASVITNPVVSQYITNKYGPNADMNDVAMKEAQDVASQKRLVAGIGSGLETIARAPSTIKPDDKFYQNMADNADQGVKDIQNRQKAQQDRVKGEMDKLKLQESSEDNDPNSPQAQAVRKMYAGVLKGFGMDESILDNASPRVINTYMEKIIQAKDASEARKLIAEQNHLAKAQMQEEKEGKDLDKNQKDYTKYMSPDSAGFNNEVRKQIDLSVSADRAGAVLNQYTDPKTGKIMMPPERFGDINLSVVNLLTNGKTSVHALEAITPKNVGLNAGKIQEWLTSDPQGVDQTKWLKDYQALIDRENGISKKYVNDYYDNQYSDFKKAHNGKFYKQDPEFYDNVYKNSVKKYLPAEAAQPSSGPQKTPAGAPQAQVPQAKANSGFPKQVTKTDPTSGKTLTATVGSDKELAEATSEGFN